MTDGLSSEGLNLPFSHRSDVACWTKCQMHDMTFTMIFPGPKQRIPLHRPDRGGDDGGVPAGEISADAFRHWMLESNIQTGLALGKRSENQVRPNLQ